MHVVTMKKESINLKKIAEGYIGRFRGKKGREKHYNLIKFRHVVLYSSRHLIESYFCLPEEIRCDHMSCYHQWTIG